MFKHLQDVHLGYFEHFKAASYLSIQLLYFSVRTLIHAIYPDIFTDTTIQLKRILN